MLVPHILSLFELFNVPVFFSDKIIYFCAEFLYQSGSVLASEEVRHYYIIGACLVKLKGVINLVAGYYDNGILVYFPYSAYEQKVCLDIRDRKSTRLNSSHRSISYAAFS